MIEEMHVYDFDGTLFRSPIKPNWWHKDYWWESEDSLGRPCVPDKPDASWWISSTVADARKSITNPKVTTVLCTGRSDSTQSRWRVPELLHQKGLKFDFVFLKSGGDTGSYKIRVIDQTLKRYPTITAVHIWEDRLPHLAEFVSHVKQMGLEGIPHPVTVPAKNPACTLETYQTPDPYAEDPAHRVAARWVGRLARTPTPESQSWKADIKAREHHIGAAIKAFKTLLGQLQPYADQALGLHPDDVAQQGKIFMKAVKDLHEVTSYLDQWIGREDQHPQIYSWRTQVLYQARNYLINPNKYPLNTVLAEVRKQADKGFEALAMAKSQGPMRQVFPEDLRAFMPKNMVVDVDPDGTIRKVTDRFANEHETLGKKIATMHDLVEHYNQIVKQVKQDLASGDEMTRLAALVTAIIMETGIRPGKEGNKVVKTVDGNKVDIDTFGATTLGPEHVRIVRDDFVELEFTGKKGTTNIATLSDSKVIQVLRSYVDQAKTGGSKFVFITADGTQFTYTDLQRYFRHHFAKFSPTDFRKLRATETVLSNLRAGQRGLYQRIREFIANKVDNLKEAVIAEVVSTVSAAYGEAQTALSHDSVDVTINSYVNPQVLLRFLSQGHVEDTLQQAISNGQQKLVFDPSIFIEQATARTAGSHTLQTILDELEEQLR